MEEWRAVVGYEGLYQVSNLGRVMSLERYDRAKKFWPRRIRVLSHDSDGYLVVCLYKDGAKKTCKVHRLVAQAFIDNPNNYPEVNHIDENKENNCIDNLEWCTTKYNLTYGHRLDCVSGEKCNTAKLTPEDVREIRRIYVKGDPQFGQSALARRFGVTHTAIDCLVKGKTWKQIL